MTNQVWIGEYNCTENEELKFTALVFIVFRLARLLVVDAGPGDIFLKFRTQIGTYSFNQNGQMTGGWIAKLFSCSHCIGFWVALFLAIIFYKGPKEILTMWVALAGSQSFLQSIAKGK